MRTLVVNAGSSSLKLSLLDDDDQLAGSKELTADGGQFDAGEVARELDQLDARTASSPARSSWTPPSGPSWTS